MELLLRVASYRNKIFLYRTTRVWLVECDVVIYSRYQCDASNSWSIFASDEAYSLLLAPINVCYLLMIQVLNKQGCVIIFCFQNPEDGSYHYYTLRIVDGRAVTISEFTFTASGPPNEGSTERWSLSRNTTITSDDMADGEGKIITFTSI